MERAQNEVSGFGRHQRDLHRGAITHFAHQDDLGRLAQCGAEAIWIVVEIMTELTLIECGFAFWMNELDRVFQGDHMNRLRLIDLIEQRGQRRRLATSSGAGHQDQPGLFLCDFVKDWRQAELRNRRHRSVQFAKDDRKVSLLAKNADAETRFVSKGIATIAGTGRQVIINQTPIALHDGEGNLLGLIGSERFNRWIDINLFELTEIFDLQWMTHRKVEVGDAVVGFQHRRKNLIEIGYSHWVYSSDPSMGGSFRNGRNFFLSIALS